MSLKASGQDPKYSITTDGVIININTGKALRPQDNGRGYKKVTLSVNGTQVQRYVHRLVAEAYIPNPANLPQVNHIDGNKSNNAVSNLEWVTNTQNQIHAHASGLKGNGLDLWNAKFTKLDISRIKKLHEIGVKQYQIASVFGVTKSTICDIVHDRRYKYPSKRELTIKE